MRYRPHRFFPADNVQIGDDLTWHRISEVQAHRESPYFYYVMGRPPGTARPLTCWEDEIYDSSVALSLYDLDVRVGMDVVHKGHPNYPSSIPPLIRVVSLYEDAQGKLRAKVCASEPIHHPRHWDVNYGDLLAVPSIELVARRHWIPKIVVTGKLVDCRELGDVKVGATQVLPGRYD